MLSLLGCSGAGARVVVSRSESGELTICSNCGDMELAFGNLVLGLSQDDLVPLLERVIELQGLPPASSIPVIYLTDNGVGLRFTQDELLELRQLLESAMSLHAHLATGPFGTLHSASGRVVH
jgi:hypothetical protein